jgi:hypothetical protein
LKIWIQERRRSRIRNSAVFQEFNSEPAAGIAMRFRFPIGPRPTEDVPPKVPSHDVSPLAKIWAERSAGRRLKMLAFAPAPER